VSARSQHDRQMESRVSMHSWSWQYELGRNILKLNFVEHAEHVCLYNSAVSYTGSATRWRLVAGSATVTGVGAAATVTGAGAAATITGAGATAGAAISAASVASADAVHADSVRNAVNPAIRVTFSSRARWSSSMSEFARAADWLSEAVL